MVKAVVKVYARLRPVRPRHAAKYKVLDDEATGEPIPRGIEFNLPPRKEGEIVNNSKDKYSFTFDRVFDSATTQEELFDQAAHDVVMGALEGYNGTVFAYGQTGSGKTFTITGGERYTDRGITPRTFTSMFEEFDKRTDTQWSCFISYLEIYNENIYDLLDRSNQDKPIEEWNKIALRDDSDGDLHLKDLLVYEAKTEQDALNLLFLGNVNRMTSETPMNQASSRSHCIFTITIEARPVDSEMVRSSKIHLVDLAGSERVYKTSSAELTRREGRYINLSLHYLEQVILALHDRSRGRSVHVPYRNSLMTSVLRDSLGGNCRTVFVATLNAETEFVEESLSTCRFAQRCSMLSHDVVINQTADPLLVIERLKRENAALKAQIAEGVPAAPPEPPADREFTMEELAECEDKVKAFLSEEAAEGEVSRLDLCDMGEAHMCAALLKAAVQRAVHTVAEAMDRANDAESRVMSVEGALEDQMETLTRLNGVIEELSAERDKWKELAVARQDVHEDKSRLERDRLEDIIQREKLQWELARATKREEEQSAREREEARRQRERKDKEADAGSLASISRRPSLSTSDLGAAAADPMSMLRRGAVFLKHGRQGWPHPRFVWMSADGSTVSWRKVDKQKVSGFILARNLTKVTPGAMSAVFKRGKGRPGRDNACFTLYAADRTLDLEVELLGNPSFAGVRPEEQDARDRWVAAFSTLIAQHAHGAGAVVGADLPGSSTGSGSDAFDGFPAPPSGDTYADSPAHSVASTPMVRPWSDAQPAGHGSAPRLPRHGTQPAGLRMRAMAQSSRGEV